MGLEAVHVGVDIGQKHDPTAVVAAQVMTTPDLATHHATRYLAQHMERLPLNTSYPDIAAYLVKTLAAIQAMLQARRAQQLAALAEQVRETGQQIAADSLGRLRVPATDLRVFLDVTGVGRPVYDLIERALRADERLRAIDLRPITFAYGDTYDRHSGRMGKAYLVSRLQALLQEQRIKLPPRHPEALAMARELKDYEIHIQAETAHDTYGAFRVGAHDDLVTALGLAVLEDPAATGNGRMRFFD